MSLHEISDDREANSDHDDARPGDASTVGREAHDRASGPDRHSSPSNGGPDGKTRADIGASDDNEKSESAAVDGAAEAVAAERFASGAVSGEPLGSVVASTGGATESERTGRWIGMQSRMGPKQPERRPPRSPGAVSDIVRVRSPDGDEGTDRHDPAWAQPSGYLAPR